MGTKPDTGERRIPVLTPFSPCDELLRRTQGNPLRRMTLGRAISTRSFVKAFYICTVLCRGAQQSQELKIFVDGMSGASAILPEHEVKFILCPRSDFGAVFEPKIPSDEVLSCCQSSIERLILAKWHELPILELIGVEVFYRVFHLVQWSRKRRALAYPADPYDFH